MIVNFCLEGDKLSNLWMHGVRSTCTFYWKVLPRNMNEMTTLYNVQIYLSLLIPRASMNKKLVKNS